MFQHIIKLILPMNTTPPKNISTIIQLYRSQLRIYRRFDTTYRLTDKFRKSYLPNYQPTPQPHQTPYKKRPPKGSPSKLNPIPNSTLHRFLIQILRNNYVYHCQTNRFKNSNLFIAFAAYFFSAYNLSEFGVDVVCFK
ncbi:hypothetical protein EC917_1157 [Bacillus thuringiensis]|uniref:Uncharacterized protein n=1 Tax=Bacillus thuringiensis TaxID=1428 RepID=A0A4R4B908_BACTU|nr:hypothetical protein EC917_1157 [Bacillus thuringiensis]TCW51521.1 hypothetical protein EC910_1157 [Bacillus thuringiensis]